MYSKLRMGYIGIAAAMTAAILATGGKTMVNAAELDGVTAKIDPDTYRVSIQGVCSDMENSFVTVSVSKEEGSVFYWSETDTEEDGSFVFSYLMDEDEDDTGLYTVNVGGNGVKLNSICSYWFATHEQIDALVNSINQCKTTDEVKSLICENEGMIGISCGLGSDLEKLSNQDKVFSTILSDNIESVGQLKDVYETAVAIQSINESEKEKISECIAGFAQTLGLDVSENGYWRSLKKQTSVDMVCDALYDKDFSLTDKKGLALIFDNAAALAVLNDFSTENRDKLIDRISEFNDKGYTSVSLTEYNKLSATAKNQAIIDTVASQPYKSFKAFEAAFAAACEANKTVSPSTDKNHSSGGGGGGYYPVVPNSVPENTPTPDSIETNKHFSDISDVPWAENAIEYLASNGIVEGVGNGVFNPNAMVTRAEFTKMLVCALEIKLENFSSGFKDVRENMWYYPYVTAAAQTGIISGISDDFFGADLNITREQMCTMIYRGAVKCGIKLDTIRDSVIFADSGNISDYASDAVTALYCSGIISGMGNNRFEPKADANRAMAAKMIYELISGGGTV